MLSPDSRALYIASAILFLLPWSLLFGSSLAFHQAKISRTPTLETFPGLRGIDGGVRSLRARELNVFPPE